MRWTKLKQQVEGRFAPELKYRVAIHTTRYREAHDQEGEFWLTLDGDKIYGSSFYAFLKQRYLREQSQLVVQPDFRDEIERNLSSEGISDHCQLNAALFQSLSQSIEEMLLSPHPLIRAIAVLDSRCGKRRLEKLDLTEEHELVLAMHGLRIKGGRVPALTPPPPAPAPVA